MVVHSAPLQGPPTGPPYRAPPGEGTGPHAATKIGVIGLRALEDPGWLAGFGWLDFQSFRLDFGLLFWLVWLDFGWIRLGFGLILASA